jgi:hypothetical protein
VKLTIACLVLSSSVAVANPPTLGTVIVDGISVSLPPHWVVTVDAKAGVVYARRDPKQKDAAVLTVGIKQATGVTEDALLQQLLAIVKDAKPIAQDVLPGGKGRAVIAMGTYEGIPAKVGAIALVDGQRAYFGLLGATPAEFDAMGGVPTLLQSLHSLHPASANDIEMENTLGRPGKRANQPDLDPDRPAVPAAELHKTWSHTTALSYFQESRRSGNTAYGHNNGQGNSETYKLAADGSYSLQTLNTVQLSGCNSAAVGLETGRYTHDGKTLVLDPSRATLTTSLCGGKSQVQQLKLTPPRKYQIAMSRDGRLIFVGTGCTPFPEGSCNDHVRFEMTVDQPRK